MIKTLLALFYIVDLKENPIEHDQVPYNTVGDTYLKFIDEIKI